MKLLVVVGLLAACGSAKQPDLDRMIVDTTRQVVMAVELRAADTAADEVERITRQLAVVVAEIDDAVDAVVVAKTDAARDAAGERLTQLRQQRHELEAKLAAARARTNAAP